MCQLSCETGYGDLTLSGERLAVFELTSPLLGHVGFVVLTDLIAWFG